MNELVEQAPKAIASVVEALPDDFPEATTTSIPGGMQRRLKVIEKASA